jgi:hypothetical protein
MRAKDARTGRHITEILTKLLGCERSTNSDYDEAVVTSDRHSIGG